MKKLTLLIVLFFSCSLLYAADGLQQQYDSVMNVMKDKSLPLLNRYYMTGDIMIFSNPQQIEILKTLIPEAKEYEDKAVIGRLYSVIANVKILLEDMKGAKVYLDSAFMYKDRIENNAILGLMCYTRGHYYQSLNDVKQAHENYYDAAGYLKKLPTLPPLLSTIYYNLARIHVLWDDEDRLVEIIEEMDEVPCYITEQYMLNYTVHADLFSVQFNKTKNVSLLDSIIKYDDLAIEQYNMNAGEETADVGHQLSQNYISKVRAYLNKGDVEAARKSLEMAEQLVNKDRWSTMMELNMIKGDYYISAKEYDQAELSMDKAIELLSMLKTEQQADYYNYYVYIYEKLGRMYGEKEMYEKALRYEKMALEYRKRLFSKENTTIVNGLRAQYNMEQKEQVVNQLTLLSERRKNIILMAGVILVLFLVLILQVIIRSRATRRANENQLKLEQMKRKESELEVKLYKARQEEKDREFEMMQNEIQQRRMQSYLEGLEAARERLSKELHDNISNELLALKMQVLQTGNREEIIDRLGQIHAEVRAVSHDLMPPAFQHAQFTEVLYDYVYQWNKLSKMQLALTFDPDDESWNQLPEDVNLGLYRIIQESVGNAIKHAQATEIAISFIRRADEISLTIRDNGRGFNVNGSYKGIGLKQIKDRAKNLNGEASLQSAPGKGTEVKVMIRVQNNTGAIH